MSKLEQLITELCPDGVVFKRLEDCCTLEKGNTPIQKAVAGKYPLVVTMAERRTCNMYQFDKPTVCIPLVSSRGHGVACLNQLYYQEGAFALGNILCGVTPKDSNELSAKFLHCYLNHQKDILIVPLMKGGANVSLTVSSLKKVKVPVPPIDVQDEIANMLSNFENLILELTAELTARKKQYEYYRDILFSFSNNAEWVKLSDVCEIYDSLHQTPKYSNTGFPMVRVVDVKGDVINRNTCLKVDEQVYKQFIKKYKPKVNDIVISRVGSYGNVGLVINDDVCLGQNVALISAKHCSCNFLFYYLQSNFVRAFIESNVKGASQKTLSLAKIKDIPFPKITEEEQNRISILMGNFHKICNDISTGLPAEIEARKKQYEYYRDKLLTFKELS